MPDKNRKRTGGTVAEWPRAPAARSRSSGGKFAPGQSGNPAGRPKGSRNKVTQFCSDLLAADAEAIIAKLLSSAKRGNAVALRLCVERLIPTRAARDRAVEFPAPAVLQAADVAAAAAEVIRQAAAGAITLSEAKEFMSLIESRRKAIETAELAVRIEALEAAAAVDDPKPVGFAPDPDDLVRRVRRLVDDGTAG